MKIKELLKKLIDILFWKYSDESPSIQILHKKVDKPFKNLSLDFDDQFINNNFSIDNNKWTHQEFLIKIIGKLTIEPDYGCVINGRIIYNQSVFYKNLSPSVIRYINAKNIIKIDEAIIFDHNTGLNYFHFYSDVFNKIWILQKNQLLHLPLIISDKLFKKKYFQHILKTTFIKDLNWIIQKSNQYLKANSIYLCKPMPYKAEYWIKTKKIITTSNHPNRRLFLNRSGKAGRNIKNFFELEPLLIKYKFEITDSENMSLQEQIEVFSAASIIIGIHGAGLTNMLYCSQKAKIFELLPGNRIATHYYWLATTLNLNYIPFRAGVLPETNKYPEGSFFVDPIKFEKELFKIFKDD